MTNSAKRRATRNATQIVDIILAAGGLRDEPFTLDTVGGLIARRTTAHRFDELRASGLNLSLVAELLNRAVFLCRERRVGDCRTRFTSAHPSARESSHTTHSVIYCPCAKEAA